ncbi:hypothetical protein DOTSEDRAFT_47302 [Dothistroma septosporum NZE10]|uniref:PQ loop repeat protein n=1 Tax=Dothistroma septosporum (strain NZE10 / CBS 128990) TaxID=675120 RepID=N1PFG6_DOTSN|nr:hypothetical protein DOTSEDRAFT_47302 [Dothistroma septosporum NZE10]
MASDHCKALENPNWFATTVAAGLVIGILISYIPQMLKIKRNKSSAGLSPYWILLGGLSSICAAGNIIALPASRADIACCREINGAACGAALLGVAQLAVQCSCFMIIVVMFVMYFPTTDAQSIEHTDLPEDPPATDRHRLIVMLTIPTALILVLFVTFTITIAFPNHNQFWADLLGTIAGILAGIQYVPQIFYTWMLQDLKSLSVFTLLVQAPGAFVFAGSLANRVGVRTGWSTWLPYVVTGTLQLILLAMAAYFKSKETSRESDAKSGDNEREPLLRTANGPSAPPSAA